MDVGMYWFPLYGRVVSGEALLDIYEEHCKAHEASPNSNIEDILARADSEVLSPKVQLTNNFSPSQKLEIGRVGDYLFVRGINHALSAKAHEKADQKLAVDTQFILERIQ
jgi:hypothetical protein